MKSLFLTTVAILAYAIAVAQTNDPDYEYQHLSLISSPTPGVASLSAQASNSVDKFTGKAVINVSLYEFNVDGFKLPISLSYNTGGIKVEDIASWVGLGWSLNAGGVITRSIMNNL